MTGKEFEKRIRGICSELAALTEESKRYIHLTSFGTVYIKGTESAACAVYKGDVADAFERSGGDYDFPS